MTPWETWWWAAFLVALDEAGYRVVRKPEIVGQGYPHRQ